MIKTSMRYCKKCKKVTSWMLNPKIKHSRCLQCNGRWAQRPNGMKFPEEIVKEEVKLLEKKAGERKRKIDEGEKVKKLKNKYKRIMKRAKKRMQTLAKLF
ncbi:MAG: hypothetical protein ABIE55_03285 [Candidatus Aenigmatarchaeota archaeon]